MVSFEFTLTRPHRASYLKTTLCGFGLSATAVAVIIYWLRVRHISIPRLIWRSDGFRASYWLSIGVVFVFAVFWFMVGVGGILSLQRDARESGYR